MHPAGAAGSRLQLRQPLQSDVTDRCCTRRSGSEPRLPVVSGLAPVICKYESVMDSRRGRRGRRRRGRGVLFVFGLD